MQYLQPAERLATWAIRRLSLRSTLPKGSQIAALICVKPCTIFGLRCMINTLFGMNPMRLRAASNCSLSSGVCSGGSGARRGVGLVRWSILSSWGMMGVVFGCNRRNRRASGFAADRAKRIEIPQRVKREARGKHRPSRIEQQIVGFERRDVLLIGRHRGNGVKEQYGPVGEAHHTQHRTCRSSVEMSVMCQKRTHPRSLGLPLK